VHILLTDVLCCPRCGPEHGLILLADELEERRVRTGRLGCANCRSSYPIRGGVADLRPAPAAGDRDTRAAAAPGAPVAASDDPEAAVRIAALLDLAGGVALALLVGGAVAHAAEVARLVPHVELVAAGRAAAPPEGLSSIVWSGPELPFRSLSLRAVALGTDAGVPPDEGLRVLGVGGRLLLEEHDPATRGVLEQKGARFLLEQDALAVASRDRHV
jgi:uncharacterized protein YbaR (Trm112 family)